MVGTLTFSHKPLNVRQIKLSLHNKLTFLSDRYPFTCKQLRSNVSEDISLSYKGLGSVIRNGVSDE
jgi:hypothetical protein